MSELTLCNYCSLKSIRARAEKNNQKLELRGNVVFVDGKFVSWFMELTDYCVC